MNDLSAKPKNDHSALWKCFALFRRHPWWLVASLALTALANGSMPLLQWLVQHAIDAGLTAVRSGANGALAADAVLPWAVALMIFAGLRGVVAWFATVVAMTHGQLILHAMRSDVFAKVQALQIDFHRSHGVGEIVARTTRDSDVVRDALTGGFRTLLEVALVTIGALGLLAWYHPLLAAVPAALFAVSCLWLITQARVIEDLDRRTGTAYDRMTQDLDEGVRGVRVIKAFSLEDQRLARFRRHVGVLARRQFAAIAASAWRLPWPQLVVALGQVWVLGFGAWLVSQHRLSDGALVASSMAILMVVFRVENIGRVVQVFASAQASAVRLRALLDAEPTVVSGTGTVPDGPLSLRWRQVRKQHGSTPVLRDVSLTVQPGQVVAVVGATGSGKSTLAMLGARAADPDDGVVELAGSDGTWRDLRQLDLRALRQCVQYLPQESFLFSDTLGGNLRLARPTASDAEIADALRIANASEIIAALPEGLATAVGERGVTLSGGQRQRLCLARALIAQPRLIIADDATSALDTVTEAGVLTQLRARTCGMLLIASRPSTAQAADVVHVLRDGVIAASGTHNDLVRSDARYRELLGLDPSA